MICHQASRHQVGGLIRRMSGVCMLLTFRDPSMQVTMANGRFICNADGGRGHIDRFCRIVVVDRLKASGRHWSVAAANAIMARRWGQMNTRIARFSTGRPQHEPHM